MTWKDGVQSGKWQISREYEIAHTLMQIHIRRIYLSLLIIKISTVSFSFYYNVCADEKRKARNKVRKKLSFLLGFE